MRNGRPLTLVALYLLHLSAPPALAQPLFAETESIESFVANADLVFVARIEKFDAQPTKDRLNTQLHSATVAIEETLKCFPLQSEVHPRMQIELPFPSSVIADWQERTCRLLVALDGEVPRQTQVIDLTPGKINVLTEDLQLLRDEDAVLGAARNAVTFFPMGVKRIHTFRLSVPQDVITGTPWEKYHGLLVNVPVNQKLEKRAQEYLGSANVMERSEGAQALRYFKSEGNIARVRQLLDDPYFHESAADEKRPGLFTRTYPVRAAAYRTLEAWGVDVDEPVITEEVPM